MASLWELFLIETSSLFGFSSFLLLWTSWWIETSLVTDLAYIGFSLKIDTALLFLDGDGTSLSFYDALTDPCLECLSIIDFALISLWTLLVSSFFLISAYTACPLVSSLGGSSTTTSYFKLSFTVTGLLLLIFYDTIFADFSGLWLLISSLRTKLSLIDF